MLKRAKMLKRLFVSGLAMTVLITSIPVNVQASQLATEDTLLQSEVQAVQLQETKATTDALAEGETESDDTAMTEAGSKDESTTGTETQSEVETANEAGTESEAESEGETSTEAGTESEQESEGEASTEAGTESEAESEGEASTEAGTESEAESEGETANEPETESAEEVSTEATTETTTENTTESSTEAPTEEVFLYNPVLEIEEPEYGTITGTVKLTDFDNINEYYSSGHAWYVYFSKTEDFNDYTKYDLYFSEDTDAEIFTLEKDFKHEGDYNTKYYVRVVSYEYATSEYTYYKSQEVTTKDERAINISMDISEPEYNMISGKITLSDMADYNDFNSLNKSFYVYVSETEDFSEAEKINVYFNSDSSNGVYTMYNYFSFAGKENTKYYIKLESSNNITKVTKTYETAEVTTKAEKEVVRSFAVEEPANNMLYFNAKIEGYADWNEFNNSMISYYAYVSEKADFSEYDTIDLSWAGSTEDNKTIITSNEEYYANPNTKYYVKFVGVRSNTDETFEYEVVEVTTKDEIVINSTLSVVENGASYIYVNFEVADFDNGFINENLHIQYSTNPEFENCVKYDFYIYSEPKDNKYSINRLINNLKPETTYYVRAICDTRGDAYRVLGDVKIVTTDANVVYDDSVIPDEAFRTKVKSFMNTFDKVSFENVTSLDLTRKSNEAEIKSLTGIELFKNINYLTIKYHDISDMSPIAKLNKAVNININSCKVATIPDLSALTQLEYMTLYGNFIPAAEFTKDNTNIPGQFRNDNWLKENRKKQRLTNELSFVVADTYYPFGTGYALQVQLNNIYALYDYKLSVYEGDNLLVEKAISNSRNENYQTMNWFFDDIITLAGEHKLTFVAYIDDVEVARDTKTINCSTENTYISDTERYKNRWNSYIGMNIYIYNQNSEITSIVLKDSAGNKMADMWTTYEQVGAWDNRYNAFYDNLIKTEHIQAYIETHLAKYLHEGNYDIEVTLTNGQVVTFDDALVISESPILYDMNTSGEYKEDLEKGEIYVSVSGYNFDWAKVAPVAYDEFGNKLSTVVEYKLTGTQDAIYKLKTIDGKPFYSDIVLKLQNNTGSAIVNEGLTKNISISTSGAIVFSEYDWLDKELFLLCRNLPEGVEYTWTLKRDYGDGGEVYATAKAAVNDGRVVLNFMTPAGVEYDFIEAYKTSYFVSVSDGENVLMDTFLYINVHALGRVNYNTSVNGFWEYYENDGSELSGGYSMDLSVYNPDATLSAVIKDEEGTIVATGTTTKFLYEEYWYFAYSFENLVLRTGEKYYIDIIDGDESLGMLHLCVLDPQKMYYNDLYYEWDKNDKLLSVKLYWNWPAGFDTSKFTMTLKDVTGVDVLTDVKAVSATQGEDYIELKYDVSSIWDAMVNEYTRFVCHVLYDGSEVEYVYTSFNSYDNTIYPYSENKTECWFNSRTIEHSEDVKISYVCRIGSDYKNKKMKVLVYYPYETSPIKTFEINSGSSGKHELTEENLDGLEYEENLRLYDVIVLDSNGKFIGGVSDVYLATGEKALATSVELSAAELPINIGLASTLTVTVLPEKYASTAEWSSNNDSIATVTQTGVVTATGIGETYVNVVAGGLTASCLVKVSGFTQGADGVWAYYNSDGTINTSINGLIEYNGAWFYLVNGVLDITATGMKEYDGRLFYVAGGQLIAAANGLVQDPTNGEWYYVASGQVVAYTGLVQYDGAWFYVSDGRLDTTMAGFVEYDGALFYVAAGKYLIGTQGLAQDPVTGKWYFLGDGMVQKQYTGLAQYDNAWFYIVNGELAEYYTGMVEYDGALFNVVAGKVV